MFGRRPFRTFLRTASIDWTATPTAAAAAAAAATSAASLFFGAPRCDAGGGGGVGGGSGGGVGTSVIDCVETKRSIGCTVGRRCDERDSPTDSGRNYSQSSALMNGRMA